MTVIPLASATKGMAMPKVSVIIAVYNCEKYLAETLDAVLAQTFTDFEIVCVNDGSRDNSLAILTEYQKRDKRIQIISQTNSGVVTARNNGVKNANGEYVYLLDSDDIIAPTTLEKTYNEISQGRADIITSRAGTFYNTGDAPQDMNLPEPTRENMIHSNCMICAGMLRRDMFIKSGGFDTQFDVRMEDYDFWLNLILRHNCTIYRIPEMLFFYRVKPKTESRNSGYKGARKKRRRGHINKKLCNKYPEYERARYGFNKPWRYIMQIRRKGANTIIRVLNLPLMRIENKSKYYLFGVLPIWHCGAK